MNVRRTCQTELERLFAIAVIIATRASTIQFVFGRDNLESVVFLCHADPPAVGTLASERLQDALPFRTDHGGRDFLENHNRELSSLCRNSKCNREILIEIDL